MPDTSSRRIEYRPLSELTPDPRNPKAHDLDTIDASIGRFGVIDAVVVDGRTGHIVSGHGRTKTLTAMRDRGEAPPEGVTFTAAGDDWLVPVMSGWSSRTDAEAAAALVALNRTTELGGWVDDALLDILDELTEMGEDALTGVGFTAKDHEALAHLTNYMPDGGTPPSRDLDALHEEVGDPTEEDKLETVSLRVSKATASRLREAVGSEVTGHEAVVLRMLEAVEGA